MVCGFQIAPMLTYSDQQITVAYRLQEETARVEDRLLERSAIESLIGAFCRATGTSFDNMLEP